MRERNTAAGTPLLSAQATHHHRLKPGGWLVDWRDVGEASFEGEELERRDCLREMEAHLVRSSPRTQCG